MASTPPHHRIHRLRATAGDRIKNKTADPGKQTRCKVRFPLPFLPAGRLRPRPRAGLRCAARRQPHRPVGRDQQRERPPALAPAPRRLRGGYRRGHQHLAFRRARTTLDPGDQPVRLAAGLAARCAPFGRELHRAGGLCRAAIPPVHSGRRGHARVPLLDRQRARHQPSRLRLRQHDREI